MDNSSLLSPNNAADDETRNGNIIEETEAPFHSRSETETNEEVADDIFDTVRDIPGTSDVQAASSGHFAMLKVDSAGETETEVVDARLLETSSLSRTAQRRHVDLDAGDRRLPFGIPCLQRTISSPNVDVPLPALYKPMSSRGAAGVGQPAATSLVAPYAEGSLRRTNAADSTVDRTVFDLETLRQALMEEQLVMRQKLKREREKRHLLETLLLESVSRRRSKQNGGNKSSSTVQNENDSYDVTKNGTVASSDTGTTTTTISFQAGDSRAEDDTAQVLRRLIRHRLRKKHAKRQSSASTGNNTSVSSSGTTLSQAYQKITSGGVLPVETTTAAIAGHDTAAVTDHQAVGKGQKPADKENFYQSTSLFSMPPPNQAPPRPKHPSAPLSDVIEDRSNLGHNRRKLVRPPNIGHKALGTSVAPLATETTKCRRATGWWWVFRDGRATQAMPGRLQDVLESRRPSLLASSAQRQAQLAMVAEARRRGAALLRQLADDVRRGRRTIDEANALVQLIPEQPNAFDRRRVVAETRRKATQLPEFVRKRYLEEKKATMEVNRICKDMFKNKILYRVLVKAKANAEHDL